MTRKCAALTQSLLAHGVEGARVPPLKFASVQDHTNEWFRLLPASYELNYKVIRIKSRSYNSTAKLTLPPERAKLIYNIFHFASFTFLILPVLRVCPTFKTVHSQNLVYHRPISWRNKDLNLNCADLCFMQDCVKELLIIIDYNCWKKEVFGFFMKKAMCFTWTFLRYFSLYFRSLRNISLPFDLNFSLMCLFDWLP